MNAIINRPLTILFLIALSVSACATGGSVNESSNKESGANNSQDDGIVISELMATEDGDTVKVTMAANGPISYTAFRLDDPKRVVIDMTGVDISEFSSSLLVDSKLVSSVRPYYFAATNDSRIEIDLADEATFIVDDSESERLIIHIGSPDTVADISATEHKMDEEPAMIAASPPMVGEEVNNSGEMDKAGLDELIVSPTKSQGEPSKVVSVGFKQMGSMSRVVITLDRVDPSYELIARSAMKRLTVDLPNARIDKENEKVINVNLDDAEVDSVAAFQFSGGDKPVVKVVVSLDENQLYNIFSKDNVVILDVGDEAALAMASEVPKEEPVSIEGPIGGEEKEFTGALISLDFQKADIHNILRILADVSGFNIITSDAVKGSVTMKLKNVPWDQALDVILMNNALDKTQEGNIIRVATRDEIQSEKEAAERKQAAEIKISPLVTQVIEVNYETASSIKTNLESVKSERGSVDINERTNALIIKDTRGKIAEMLKLVARLDKQESQVLIESRIVEVTRNRQRDIGVQWGGLHHTVTDNLFPNTVGVTGGISPGGPNNPAGGTAVNTAPTSAMGAIGITLGHINGTAMLDAKLLAMERNGDGRIVSMPKITTMNNKKAIIESGREIPYQTTSADGTSTTFRKATLKLEVTPHITPNKFVRMVIVANKDEADFSNNTQAGPPILTKHAETEVIVRNGDTAVLGGLFKNTDQNTIRKVPLFGDIPFLGWLFKGELKKIDSEELLIFITPKVLEYQE